MNPSFLAQEPWGWPPEAVGRVSFVTAKRLYLDPAREQNAPAKSTTVATAEPGWDWTKGVPPRDVFVSMVSERGVSEADAVATWEKLSNGQKADERG